MFRYNILPGEGACYLTGLISVTHSRTAVLLNKPITKSFPPTKFKNEDQQRRRCFTCSGPPTAPYEVHYSVSIGFNFKTSITIYYKIVYSNRWIINNQV